VAGLHGRLLVQLRRGAAHRGSLLLLLLLLESWWWLSFRIRCIWIRGIGRRSMGRKVRMLVLCWVLKKRTLLWGGNWLTASACLSRAPFWLVDYEQWKAASFIWFWTSSMM
jgi:hypothetical protein